MDLQALQEFVTAAAALAAAIDRFAQLAEHIYPALHRLTSTAGPLTPLARLVAAKQPAPSPNIAWDSDAPHPPASPEQGPSAPT